MENKQECKEIANNLINSICSLAGCNLPDNKDNIIDYIVQNVKEIDPINWHSGNISTAFRKWMEHNGEF